MLSGAGFTAYLKSSLPVRADGSYDFDKATPVVIGENGKTTIFTDNKGYACSIAIPYGTYVVLETVTPHNMETIKPFEVTVRENNPTKPQVWRIFLDREFSAKLRIIKKDAYTGKTVLIPNTEFKIYNLDKKEYVSMTTTYPSKVIHTSFFTDEDGDLILPDVLNVGNYRIEEIAAPYGYVLNENYVEVAVDSDTFYEVDQDTYEAIITIDYEDQPEFGELTIIKKGEVLDAYEGGFFADSDEKTFIYREGTLAGAKFEVYAAEDIYTADMQLDENGNRTKYYSKVVAKTATTAATTAAGTAVSPGVGTVIGIATGEVVGEAVAYKMDKQDIWNISPQNVMSSMIWELMKKVPMLIRLLRSMKNIGRILKLRIWDAQWELFIVIRKTVTMMKPNLRSLKGIPYSEI
ncbi:SpaA isopeptide-forming pilin-related protein [Coprococcus sp. RTP31081st1_D2_RTP31081_211007]|uniref:MSCRAMM family protein n=1 Tax=unclassified Coprococcus TaxID=2684943 RepID=UPI0032EAFBE6